ncbi:cytochrome-c oxidase, cbb3-type subunit III [Magnetospirillum aberrantis]|uniref:Cbb3-type cytochrome c oxidase subunit n=1 Tax=Magnetospirillum aberrantis SpK TaxID=908842 RepID=A0A7C9QV65_9PROT|nr:cytochrome-c oxidase, cbb3-type subunit III [Magnetospirillum aberrantis]NFV80961.1 cytochrome-c oxidase, cbb3-type subunit III [Magnetospirillum aberrantis SpK]
MASMEKDSVSGQYTTGHEWDGIRELNTPLPKWWVYVFWATVIWSIAYWVAMPAWPTINDYSRGVLGYASRNELESDIKAQKQARSKFEAKIAAISVDDVVKDKDLRNFAMTGGKVLFNDNCAPCHGTGGVGAPGAYPNLADDEWIWGGELADLKQTISFGVRNTNENSRQSEMPKFGADGLLTAEQINQVADYVVALSSKGSTAGLPGEAIFAEQCVVCHQDGGVGSKDVGSPALNNNIWLFKGSKEQVKQVVINQVTNPQHGSMPAWSERLDETSIKMLTVYVHSLGGGK